MYSLLVLVLIGAVYRDRPARDLYRVEEEGYEIPFSGAAGGLRPAAAGCSTTGRPASVSACCREVLMYLFLIASSFVLPSGAAMLSMLFAAADMSNPNVISISPALTLENINKGISGIRAVSRFWATPCCVRSSVLQSCGAAWSAMVRPLPGV